LGKVYRERLPVGSDPCQELTPDAEIANVRFTKSVIASKAAFTYEEAQMRKDDP
jgi:exoribonuclease R